MSREVLPESRIHPAIHEKISSNHRDIVEEVQAAIRQHRVVVVGMAINPFPRRACKALSKKGITFHYLGYGSYFGMWRRRTALKMWTGWPTFPMIFIDGLFIGGATDLARLIESGELDRLLAQPRAAA